MTTYYQSRLSALEFQTRLRYPELPLAIDDTTLSYHLGMNNWAMWWLVRSRNEQYRIFRIPKPNGKWRHIQCPKNRMKFAQRSILLNILEKIPMGSHIGAYVPGRACSFTAAQHVGRKIIISIDLKDFFPSVKQSMIRNYFHEIGYNQQVSGLLAALLTYENYVPQGASSSGYIANVIADYRFDREILAELSDLDPNWVYTRYSDDLDISHPEVQTQETTRKIIGLVTRIVQSAGFKVHYKKTHREHYFQRQKVLGMVVNEKTNIPIEEYLRVRGILHDVLCYGEDFPYHAEGQPITLPALMTKLFGKINYFKQINPIKATKLLRLYEAADASLEKKDANLCIPSSTGNPS